ncbi:Ig-like domain-containing protein [Parapedobacter indicus]|uniref:Gliding motility-associated C-terminal domain-containing protein n=1 Tax=Parapedobacter indicus TaxID=1477437 RepID=A0A1I3R6I4_9SPHI|nr:Ig-like domain-containing protein [Parapedobacter indicus]PPL00361.1 gliding motility-associated-like protein [Parapedobacter indicus]SFJ41372.1 gliding motility-associated C-terminal domain-containing protein [Parapedobacter indicus]
MNLISATFERLRAFTWSAFVDALIACAKLIFFVMVVCSMPIHAHAQLKNNALHFDADARITGLSGISPTSFTIEFWMKSQHPTGAIPKYQGIYWQQDGLMEPGAYVDNFDTDDGTQTLAIFPSSSANTAYQAWSASTPDGKIAVEQQGTWRHYAITSDGSTISFYYDGVLIRTATHSGAVLPITNVTIGGGLDGYTLDELRIWNTARTLVEIEEWKNSRVSRGSVGAIGLVRYYNFDQGTANGDNTGVTELFEVVDNKMGGVLNGFTLNGTTSNWVNGAPAFDPPPVVSTHPGNEPVCNGGNASFTIVAARATSYKWYVNTGAGFLPIPENGVYSGTTTATLTITGATAAMNGYQYRCVAINGAGTATSNPATLTVSTLSLSGSQTNVTFAGGSNGTATITPSGGIGSYSYSYSWSPSGGTGATATGLSAGDYTVTVTDLIGCSATYTVTISEPPAITSASYNATTGVLVVTGTNLLPVAGSNNDIIANKFAFTGEGGETIPLTDTENVEITNETSFTLTLSEADRLAVNPIMNKNSTSSTGGTTYNLAAAEGWAEAPDPAMTVADLTGNGITVTNVPEPKITSATYDANTGTVVVTGTGFLSLTGSNNDIVAGKFTFTGEGGETITLTDTENVEITSGTSFTLILSATDRMRVNTMMNKNGTSSTGGTTYNLAAAEDWAAGADAAVAVADTTGNGITVSNVPVPTITSATYDAGTGILVVTGTGFLSAAGSNNDIIANKFTLTGEGGEIHTLTDTENAEITSGTSFTLALSAADRSRVNVFMNKSGTSSTGGTTYNLAAAEGWGAGADAATDIADLTGNGITVTNVPEPEITSATYDANTGTVVVTGMGFLSLAGSNNDIVAGKFTFTGEGGETITLTDTENVEITSGTSFTLVLSAADRMRVNTMMNKNGTSSTGGTTYNLAAAEDWAAGADAAVAVADTTGNGITVSNVPVPEITSTTFDGTTGVLTVTGTGFLSAAGSSNDIKADKFTFRGQGGNITTLSIGTADVDITDGTSFTMVLGETDRLAVVELLNENGVSALDGTLYNLAAAEDWAQGADAAVVVASTTGNGITVTNAPKPPMATNMTQSKAMIEDEPSIALGDIVVTDVNVPETITATLTLNPAVGTLTTGTYGSATSTFNAGVWTVAGSVADVNAALAAVAFRPAANWDQDFSIITRIRDAAGTGPDDGSILVIVTRVNDAPTLVTTATNPTFVEGSAAVSLFSGTSVSTIESDQGVSELKLMVLYLNDGASEILTIDGTEIALIDGTAGTTTGGDALVYAVSLSGYTATVTLSSGSGITATAMAGLINGMTYHNTSVAPTTGGRTISLTSIEDNGGTANGGVNATLLAINSTVTVQAVNSPPALVNLNGDHVAWAGAGNEVILDAETNVTLNDDELEAANGGNGNWAGANLTVQRAGFVVPADVLDFSTSGALFTVSGNNLQSGGQTFASYTNTGGVLAITFTSSGTIATTAIVNDVVRRITYRNDTPAGDAIMRFALSDGNDDAIPANIVVDSDIIYVTNSTDTYTIDVNNGVSLSEAVAIAAADGTGMQTLVFLNTLADQTITLAGNLSIGENLVFNVDAASGLTLAGSTITLGGGTTLGITNGAGNQLTITSTMAGTGGLTKSGQGSLVLTSASNRTGWSGAMTVTDGNLVATTGSQVSSGTLTFDGGTLSMDLTGTSGTTSVPNPVILDGGGGTFAVDGDNGNTVTLSGVVSGSGQLVKTGAAKLYLTNNANTYTGTMTVATGTLEFTNVTSLGSGAITIDDNATLSVLWGGLAANAITLAGNATVNTKAVVTLSGVISGANNLTKSGTGSLTLAGTNTYTGTTTVAEGTVVVSNDHHLGTGAVILSDGATLLVSAGAVIDNPVVLAGNATVNTSLNLTLSGIISGSGSLTKISPGKLLLSGNNTYSGSTIVNEGTLSVASDANLGADGLFLGNSTTLDVTGSTTLDNSISLGGNATLINSADVTLSGVISGGNNLSIQSTSAVLTLAGNNTYPGMTNLVSGSLRVGNDSNLGAGSINLADGTTLEVTDATDIENAVTLAGIATVNTSNTGGAATLSGVITGAGGLTKTGVGTLALAASNGYTGATTVSTGTLLVNGATAGSTTVSAGATLAGTGTLGGDVAVNSGGTLSPGGSPGVLTINGGLTMQSGSTLAVEIDGTTAGTDHDQVVVNGTVDVSSTTLVVTHGYAASQDETYVIIVNDATDAISGTFSGLAEDARMTASGNSTVLTGSYIGGTGNDFMLTVSDVTPPTVTEIEVSGTPGAAAESVDYTVTFNEAPDHVSITDFALTGTATATIARVSSVSGNSVTVTLNEIAGTGTLRLDVIGGNGITDVDGNGGGNNGYVAAFTAGAVHTVDRDAPDAPSQPDLAAGSDSGSSDSDDITSDATPTITGTAEANATVEITSHVDGVLGTETADGGGNWSFIPSTALTEGMHSLTATATDAAGNVSLASPALEITIDVTAPVKPAAPKLAPVSDSGESNTDNMTNLTDLSLQGAAGSVEAGARIHVRSDVDGGLANGTANADGSWSLNVMGLAATTHQLQFNATDAAGNTGVYSDPLTVVIDDTPPTVSGVTFDQASVTAVNQVAISLSLSDAETGTSASFTITSSDGGTPVTVSGLVVGSAMQQFAGIDVGGLKDGTLTVSLTVVDVAGNTSPAVTGTIGKDARVPTVTNVAITDGDYAEGGAISLSVTLDEDVTVSGRASTLAIEVGGTTRQASFVSENTGVLLYQYTVQAGDNTDGAGVMALANGISLNGDFIRDAVGNDAALVYVQTGNADARVDTKAPVEPTVISPAASISVNADDYTISGVHAENGVTVKLYLDADNNGVPDNALVLDAYVVTGGGWSLNVPLVENTTNNVVIIAEDAAGNVSGAADVPTITEDSLPPAVPFVPTLLPTSDSGASDSDNLTNHRSVTLTGTAEPNSTVALTSDRDGVVGSARADGLGNWRIITGNLSIGVHGLMATATDAAGNTSASSAALLVRVDTQAPSLTAVIDQYLQPGASSGSLAMTLDDETTPAANLAFIATSSDPAVISLGGIVLGGSGRDRTVAVTATGSGMTTITLSAEDEAGNIGTTTFTVTVNSVPTIGGTPATHVDQDAAYRFIPTAEDIDAGDVLSFSITNKPEWADFDAVTGELSGMPGNGDVGVTTGVVITVSDGALSTSLPAFDLEVVNVNDPPTITGTPDTSVAQDAAYSFMPTGRDIDGDLLSYSIINKPEWADFDPVTGELSGTPSNADVGTTTGIVITGSDGKESASLAAFDLEVTSMIILGVTLPDISFVYDGMAKSLAVEGALPNGTLLTYTNNSRMDVGSQTVTATITGAGYTPLILTADLTVTPATITGITLASDHFVYDGTTKSLRITGMLPAGTAVSYTHNSRIDVGTQEVTAMVSGSNHETLTLTAELIVTPTTITGVTLAGDRFVYDGTAKSLAITGTLPTGTVVSYTHNNRIDVGTQEVTATVSGSNYETLVLTADLTVTPTTHVMVFPVLPEKVYGDADFDAGATVSSGEPIIYTSSDASVVEITRDGLLRITGAGEATITATVPENGNYANRPSGSHTLTIRKASQTIAFNAPAEVHRNAGSIPLEVSATSGQSISLTVDDEQVATVVGTVLHIHRLGTVRIAATQAGNANYEAAEPVTVTVHVTDPKSDFPIRVHHAVSPNGDGINEYLIIEAIKDYPDNRVRIFNRNGTEVYQASGYNNGTVAFRGIGTGQQRVPEGTYFYTAEVRVNGEWEYRKGYFVLRY